MASLLASAPETFTGTNGATPNTANTAIGVNEGSGGSWQIQGNQGRLRTGTSQFNRSGARCVVAARQNAEMVFDWVVPASNYAYTSAFMRHSTTAMDGISTYYFTLEQGQMEIGRNASYSGTTITTVSHSGTVAGTIMRTRIALFGSTIKVRTWPAANAENTGAWDATVTDSVITAAGYFGFTNSSATSGSKDLFVDNLDLLDTETPTQKKITVGGSVTAGGVLAKTARKAFAGSITAAGLTSVRRVVVRVFTGAINVAGALNGKQGAKNFGGTIALTGTLAKRSSKRFAGSIAPSATLGRRVTKRLGGTIAASGVVLLNNVGRVFGRPGIVVMAIRKAGQVRSRIRKG